MDKTFLKGLAVMEAMSQDEGSSGVTELAEHLGLGKSNVHRLLQTLVHAGYVRRVEAVGRYELTTKLWELGARIHRRLDLRTEALPFMEQLAAVTHETVHLSILDGADVLYIEKIDSPQPVRAYTAVAGRAPAACVATGKAMLAWASVEDIALAAESLQAHTPQSITSAAELDRQLQQVRKLGYAVNTGEWREQVVGLAAPIHDVYGTVVAALGISGPLQRLDEQVIRDHVPFVMEMADQVSQRLGYRPHLPAAPRAQD